MKKCSSCARRSKHLINGGPRKIRKKLVAGVGGEGGALCAKLVKLELNRFLEPHAKLKFRPAGCETE